MFLCHVNLEVGIVSLYVRKTYLNLIALALLCLDGNTIGRGAPSVVTELLLAIDEELEVSATFNVHDIFASLFRCEGRFILCREVLELNARSEVVHASSRDSQRRGVLLRADRLALHLAVVPEGAFHALFAIEAATRSHEAVEHLVVSQVASGNVLQLSTL